MEELDDYDYQNSLKILIEEFQKSEEDIAEGRTINYSDFKEKLQIKYFI